MSGKFLSDLKGMEETLDETPWDWTTRSILADYYEDHGEIDLATFHRFLVRVEKCPARWDWYAMGQGREWRWRVNHGRRNKTNDGNVIVDGKIKFKGLMGSRGLAIGKNGVCWSIGQLVTTDYRSGHENRLLAENHLFKIATTQWMDNFERNYPDLW